MPGALSSTPGDRQPLLLPARHAGSRGRRRRCRGPRAASGSSAAIRAPSSAVPELVLGRLGPGVQQVGPDRVVEQVRVLADHADGVAQRSSVAVRTSTPPTRTAPAGDVVQPRHQLGDRGLAGAGVPDQRDQLAGLDAEGDVVQDVDRPAVLGQRHLLQRRQRDVGGRRVAEGHVVELDRPVAGRHRHRVGRLGDHRRAGRAPRRPGRSRPSRSSRRPGRWPARSAARTAGTAAARARRRRRRSASR